ncbi:MAG: hypothetical protein ABL883_01665 [Terricaulis sp.]
MRGGSVGLFLILVTVSVLSACASSPLNTRGEVACSGFASAGADAEEIRRLEQRGAATKVEGWTIEAARSFFAPEWFSVQPDGSEMRLNAVFATFQDGRSRPWAGRFDLVELDIRLLQHGYRRRLG